MTDILGLKSLGYVAIGAGLIALSVFLGSAMSALKSAGAAEVEMARLEQVTHDTKREMERREKAAAQVLTTITRANKRIVSSQVEQTAMTVFIEELLVEGEGIVCPIDCLLPVLKYNASHKARP